MIVELNLPPPSGILVDLGRRTASSMPVNLDNKQWLDQFHDNKINSALHLFGHFDKVVNQQLVAEYQNFFPKHTIKSGISIMQNNTTDNTACQPPHTDRLRKLAINCYIDLGGDQVETVFYKAHASTHETTASNFLYKDTGGVDSKTVFPIGWYAYNVDQIHSVENLKTTRIFFSIKFAGLEATYDIEQLLKDYPELIKQTIP
jgi:hypothetical protein